jgi:N-acetyl-anhydromuramyl-L-alanine amidase AmpD
MESPNQEYLRRGNKVQGFVIHMTEGTFKSAVAWCTDQETQVSYHFIIDKNGDNVCLVMPENTAWHAGIIKNPTTEIVKYGINPNLYTIGIALAGFADEGPTMQQIFACAKLLQTLAVNYNIALDKNTVVPHHSIRSDKLCPGIHVDFNTLLYLSKLPLA